MRVYQINSVFNEGSTGRIAAELSNMLERAGHVCRNAYGRGSHLYSEKLYKITGPMGNRYHAMMTRITDKHGLYNNRETHRLIDDIVLFEPDIIQLHNIHGYYMNYKIFFAFLRQYGKPVFWTLHDCWAFTGHCSYFDFTGCVRWETGCYSCPQKKEYPASYFLDASTSNYKGKKKAFDIQNLTIITPSQWLKALVEKSIFCTKNICVVNNGINLDAFAAKKSATAETIKNLANGKKIVLGVANIWDKRKGYHDFIKLCEMGKDVIQIVLVGLNKMQIKNLPKEIIGINRTKDVGDLANLYSAADVFVNPTYEDNFPTVNIEALAAGTPVVTYATGGSPEILSSDCGYVAAKGDIEALYNAIIKSEKNSEACVDRAASFDRLHTYEKYIDLYNTAINNDDIVGAT